MKIIPKKSKNILELPADILTDCLSECDETKLKVLICLSASPEFQEDKVCEELDITKRAFRSALEFWIEKGAFEKQQSASKTQKSKQKAEKEENITVKHAALMHASELPRYAADEISRFFEDNDHSSELLMGCQRCIGKVFSTAEVEIVVGLKDYLKLDDDYILLLFSHCAKMGKKSLRYIEKLAVGLFDEGVLAYDELDEHLNAIEAAHSTEQKLRGLFGVGRRALTKKEKETFELWMGKWKLTLPLIERAYEVTVENTGGASIPYCSAVLERWYTNGYTTVEEVNAAMEEYKHDKTGTKDKKGSFETDDFFEAALKRSYGE